MSAKDVGGSADTAAPWTVADARAHYHMDAWGGGFFSVNARGHVQMQVDQLPPIDVAHVVAEVSRRGVDCPVLIRFQDILAARVHALNAAFNQAREELDYAAPFRGVYPIKVNQMHEVVDEILQAGAPYDFGLECGSKAELVASVALLERDESLLICNGYKDDAMLGLILDAQQLGKNVVPVVEKFDEFERLWALAQRRGATPRFGVRMRLTASSAGHWADSSGDRSKFGVSVGQLVRIAQRLQQTGRNESLMLLHCHLGSQIPDIMTLAQGVRELAQVYVQLCQDGLQPAFLDVGGGLGVNYDAGVGGASQTAINYTLSEYANTVVSTVAQACAAAGQRVPTLITESGRALTAHHSMLVVPALGAYGPRTDHERVATGVEDHALIDALSETLTWVNADSNTNVRELLEAYHDACARRRDAVDGFRLGYLSLSQKAQVDALYFEICLRITALTASVDKRTLPAELIAMAEGMVDQYLCDFSVFQSMLDHWAIGQRFPIVPLQRLNEMPDRRAVLVDLTCDSDGKISRYVSYDEERASIDVHALRDGEPYYFGFFLMGAYQDILGDAHNLFGQVSEVHVYADADEPDGFYIEKILPGSQVQDMLGQVQYFPNDLQRRLSESVRRQVQAKALRAKDGAAILDRYRALFSASPYLHHDHEQTTAKAHSGAMSGGANVDQQA
ncbi:MAG: biosynthetic arginine decarboxylase [Gammaproteobacteria bacterium]